MLRRFRLLQWLFCATALAGGGWLGMPAVARAQGLELSPALEAEIGEVLAEKQRRSPAERKLDSSLLYEWRRWHGRGWVPRGASFRRPVGVDTEGRVVVDIRCDVVPALRARLAELGGETLREQRGLQWMRARLPIRALLRLAESPHVGHIRRADRFTTHKIDTSEGDETHRADLARQTFGVDGSGIRIGVISDGVDSLAALQGSGDLPAVTVLPGQSGRGSEGTAMLEIVHDLAPGAELLFATGFSGQANFAANVLDLRAAGADIIVDDLLYFAEPAFQDGIIAQAVNQVTAEGALYFSSAGNSGNARRGTAGVWEGDYAFSGTTVNGIDSHDFGGGEFANTITEDSPSLFNLQWSDPVGGSSNDYDLFLVNGELTELFDASTNFQIGFGTPYEEIDSSEFDDTGNRLIIVRVAGAGRYLHLNTQRGELAIATEGQTYGHSAAADAFSVGAVSVAQAVGGVFDETARIERFSSDGPRRVFFDAAGVALTPGDFSSTGGQVRAKPDLSAADGVSTATPGFDPFFGTSAAAPHAAAIAALALERLRRDGDVTLGPAEVTAARSFLEAGAIDIENNGPDVTTGVGLLDAFESLALLDLPACSNGADDDGDGLVDFPDDPGCASDASTLENPACSNGRDDDLDGLFDFDGAGVGDPDPECAGLPFQTTEAMGCGLGPELGLVLPLMLAGWRRRCARA